MRVVVSHASAVLLLAVLCGLSLLSLRSCAAPLPGAVLATWPPAGLAGANSSYSLNGASQLSISPIGSGGCSSSPPLLYVADRFNNRVLAIDSSSGQVVRVYNNSGALSGPLGAVSDGASLYVTEVGVYPNRITKLSLATDAQQAQVHPGSSLYGLGVDATNGYLYATVTTTSGGAYAMRLRSSDLAIVANISAAYYPVALAVAGGNVYVTDVRVVNATVAAFSVNYPNPSTISTLFDRNSTVAASFGLAIDSAGNVYQNDMSSTLGGTRRIVVWSPTGVQLLAINFTALSTGYPYGVAVDCTGAIYASDGQGRVWKFQGLATAASSVSGDPSFVGLLGQRYQVHGLHGSVYALISDAQVQVNARFGFLASGHCLRDADGAPLFTCWSHPGSYLTAVSIRTTAGALRIDAGPAATGFAAVQVEGQAPLMVGGRQEVGQMSVELVDERTVRVRGAGVYALEVKNSDGFVNLQSVRVDDWERLTGQLHSHGLLGQTWRVDGVEGREVQGLEGRVDDYALDDGLMGCRFVYSRHLSC